MVNGKILKNPSAIRVDEDIEGGLRKFLHTRRGGSEKIVGLGEGI